MLLMLWVIYPSNCDYKENGSHFVVPPYFYHAATITEFWLGGGEPDLDSGPSTCTVAAKLQKAMKKDSTRFVAVAATGEQWSKS